MIKTWCQVVQTDTINSHLEGFVQFEDELWRFECWPGVDLDPPIRSDGVPGGGVQRAGDLKEIRTSRSGESCSVPTYLPGEPVHAYLVHVVVESLWSLQLEVSQHVVREGGRGCLARKDILVSWDLSSTWVLPGLRRPRWPVRELSVFSCWWTSLYWAVTGHRHQTVLPTMI